MRFVDFDLSEDQEMLKSVAERFVADRYDADRRRAYLDEQDGFSAANWALLSELGIVGAAFAVGSGGLGAGRTDLAIVFEALGRACIVEPLAESAVLAGGLFDRAASPALRAVWLDAIVSGDKRLVVAHRNGGVTADRHGDAGDWTLRGSEPFVPGGSGADGFIVSTMDAGEAAFFLVPAQTPGLTSNSFRLIDGSVGVALTLSDVVVREDHRLNDGVAAFAAAEELATIARGAEALGIMEMMFFATRDYLRTRQQFGAPLGSFQAVQHRMVAQYAALEQARALLTLAVMVDPDDGTAATRALSGMRAFIAEASVALGHEMIQLHGAMGVTDELIIGQAHKRLVMLSRYPEGPLAALDRYAA